MFGRKGFNKRIENVSIRRLFVLFSAFVCLCLLFLSPVYSQTILQKDLYRSFASFELVELDGQATLAHIKNRQQISIPLADKTYNLILTPRDLRAPEYRAESTTSIGLVPLEKGSVTTFKGEIANIPNSQVRISIEGANVEGYFKAVGEQYFIEPANRYSKNAGEKDHVIYRSGEYLNNEGIFCETELAKNIENGKNRFETETVQTPQAFKILKIATEADLELVTGAGGATQANNRILSL